MCSVEPGGSATGEVVAGVVALAAELATRPAPDSGAACFAQAETLGRAVDLLESAIAARVGVAAREGQVAEWGHTSPTAWLRTSLGMRHARADERAVLAEQLPRLPQVAERLAAGELSSGYAAAIAGGVRRLDESDCGKAEQVLLGLVDDGHSVGQLIRFADRIKDLIAERDGTAVEPEDGRRAERQWWAVHRSGSGAFVKGRFGAELMALIQARLGPLARPCGAEDARDHAERLADALQAHLSGADSTGTDSRWDPILVIEVEQSAPPKPAVREPVQPEPAVREPVEMPPVPAGSARHPVGVPATTTDVEPERTASSRPIHGPGRPAGRPRATGATAANADGDGDQHHPTAGRPPKPPAPWWPFSDARLTGRLADGTPVPAERVRTILLNAGFSALVLGSDGQPLYLGRRVRCASPAQRRVLVTRYATCAVEGCEIPAIACQIDHVNGWAAGQPTDIDLLVPCCAFHNRYKARHPDRVTIHQDANGRYRYRIARPNNGPGSRYAARGRRRPGRPAAGRDP